MKVVIAQFFLFCFQFVSGFILIQRRSIKTLQRIINGKSSTDNDFRWDRHWYPVHIVKDIEVDKPTKVTLLERDYVLWKQSGSNEITAFLDQCPHRLVPLSEGRIEKSRNSLQCAYHGWEFDVKGACTKIPQMGNDAAAKSRACLTQIPISITQGLVFLWPDTSDDGRILASLSTPHTNVWFDDCSLSDIAVSVRDLPYGYDTLLENIVDPSHLPFAHHGVVMDRNKVKSTDYWKLIKNDMNEMIIRLLPNVSMVLIPPSLAFTPVSAFHAIPVAPGQSRIIVQFFRVSNMKGLSAVMKRMVPRWYVHAKVHNGVLDGDCIFLHKQERTMRLRQKEYSGSIAVNPDTRFFYTPSKADLLVTALRKWLGKVGQPAWFYSGSSANLPPEIAERSKLLDRLNQHTVHCSSCRVAYRNLKLLSQALDASSVLLPLTILASFASKKALSKVCRLPALLGGAGVLGLLLKLSSLGIMNWTKEKFEFKDYVHAYL